MTCVLKTEGADRRHTAGRQTLNLRQGGRQLNACGAGEVEAACPGVEVLNWGGGDESAPGITGPLDC